MQLASLIEVLSSLIELREGSSFFEEKVGLRLEVQSSRLFHFREILI